MRCAALVALAVPSTAQCLVEPLVASDAEFESFYGWSTAVSADTAMVGRAGHFVVLNGPGRVYVYEPSGTDWIETQVLTASDGVPYDMFGLSADLDGKVAVIGAPKSLFHHDEPGAAYVFERQHGDWVETAKLEATDLALNDDFGETVAVSGDVVVVGATVDTGTPLGNKGWVYVFEKGPSGWTQTQRLDSGGGALEPYLFATSVDVDGDRIVVGAPGHPPFPAGASSPFDRAFVFERTTGSFVLAASLGVPQVGWDDAFGKSVAISGETVVVGRPADTIGGTAFVFDRVGGTWIQSAAVQPVGVGTNDQFGDVVSIDGEDIAVGAAWASPPLVTGMAWHFERTGPASFVETRLDPTGLGSLDAYGEALAVGEGRVLVGAKQSDAAASNSGAAYLWSIEPSGCPPISGLPSTISVAAGGTQTIAINGGPAAAGLTYFLLGTVSGTAPGIDLGPVNVPLNSDLYLVHTLTSPNGAPLSSSLGLLDAEGTATAFFTLPPASDPSLAGVVAHHAWVRIDFALPGVDFASEAVEVALEP